MKHSPSLAKLIDALRTLPGVGQKTAQRMAFYLLQEGRGGANALAGALSGALELVRRCGRCRMLTESELCGICSNPQRDVSLLCVVESPSDVVAIEQSGSFRGRYFVLMGHISPLDGIGPKEVGIDRLITRANDGVVKEVILATNFTHEGEATAHYIFEALKAHGLKVTRLARGVPLGGELEYVDPGTIAQALADRRSAS